MTKIVKFPKDKIEYSDHFFRKVDPKAVSHSIMMSNPQLSPKVAHAIALALVYTTYVELVLDEEEIKVNPHDIVVQRGTNHAWANRGSEYCTMAFVLIDGEGKRGAEQ